MLSEQNNLKNRREAFRVEIRKQKKQLQLRNKRQQLQQSELNDISNIIYGIMQLEHSEQICQLLKEVEMEWVRCSKEIVEEKKVSSQESSSSFTKLSNLFVNLVASYVESSKNEQNMAPSDKILKICQLVAKLASDSHIKTINIPFILLQSMVQLIRHCPYTRPIKDIFLFMTLCCQNQQFSIIDRSHCLDVILDIAIHWINHNKIDIMSQQLTTLLYSYCYHKTSHGTTFNYQQSTKILDIAIYFIQHKYYQYVYQKCQILPLDYSIQIMHCLIDNDRCSPNKISYPLSQLTEILLSQQFTNHTKIIIMMIVDEVIQQSPSLSLFLIQKCRLLTVLENVDHDLRQYSLQLLLHLSYTPHISSHVMGYLQKMVVEMQISNSNKEILLEIVCNFILNSIRILKKINKTEQSLLELLSCSLGPIDIEVQVRFWHQITQQTSYRGKIPNYILHNTDYEEAQLMRQRLNV